MVARDGLQVLRGNPLSSPTVLTIQSNFRLDHDEDEHFRLDGLPETDFGTPDRAIPGHVNATIYGA
jgi:hypothetical protein